MKNRILFCTVCITMLLSCNFLSAKEPSKKKSGDQLPLVFEEDFEKGLKRWELLDPKTMKLSKIGDNSTLEITSRKSAYRPKHRSPYHIALIKEVKVADFVLTFKVRSTKDTGNHRDCCVFFGWQDPTHFYYVHLGAKPDPHSGQVMIVKEAPRKAITKNKNRTPWDDKWHQVKLVRNTKKGTITIYFDDMKKPLMQTVDKTFQSGRIGLGSFDDMNEFDEIKLHGK